MPTTQIEAVRTIGVPVTDQDRSLRFYVETLGFEKRADFPLGPGQRWIVVAPPRGTTDLALELAREDHPAGVETGIRLISADAEAAHAALSGDGVEADPVLRWDGVPPMFAFRDPDGNRLEIVEHPRR